MAFDQHDQAQIATDQHRCWVAHAWSNQANDQRQWHHRGMPWPDILGTPPAGARSRATSARQHARRGTARHCTVSRGGREPQPTHWSAEGAQPLRPTAEASPLVQMADKRPTELGQACIACAHAPSNPCLASSKQCWACANSPCGGLTAAAGEWCLVVFGCQAQAAACAVSGLSPAAARLDADQPAMQRANPPKLSDLFQHWLLMPCT